jgi:hypothetical protein
MSARSDAAAQAQRERAQQAWELVVHDAAEANVIAALRRVLRVKRSELPALVGSLPGCVRRGARIDLAPYEASLTEAGVRCSVRRRETGSGR